MFNLASIPLVLVGGGIGAMVQEAVGLAVPLSLSKFSRGFEAEADYLGVEYVYKTGYDPLAFISFFERVQAQEKQKPGMMSKAFSTHPQTADRVHKTQVEITKILPDREAYVTSTSDFEDAKARLVAAQNRHHTVQQEADRPTLRRRVPADDGESNDDQHPTLKRRGD